MKIVVLLTFAQRLLLLTNFLAWAALFEKFLNLMCGKDLRKEETKLGWGKKIGLLEPSNNLLTLVVLVL